MEQSSQQNTLRSSLLFIAVGAVLLMAVILGVRFAKSRSNNIQAVETGHATQQTTTSASPKVDEQKKSSAQKQPSTQSQSQVNGAATMQPSTTATAQSPSPHATDSSPSSRVPSTGMEDVILPIGALAAVVFAGINYVQSRRRLVRLS